MTKNEVCRVWLKGYGNVLVTKLVATNGDILWLATNDLDLTDRKDYEKYWSYRWDIEFHRGIKQTTGIESCQAGSAKSQLTHIFAATLSFVKLEKKRIRSGTSWYEQKADINRSATRSYLLASA